VRRRLCFVAGAAGGVRGVVSGYCYGNTNCDCYDYGHSNS